MSPLTKDVENRGLVPKMALYRCRTRYGKSLKPGNPYVLHVTYEKDGVVRNAFGEGDTLTDCIANLVQKTPELAETLGVETEE